MSSAYRKAPWFSVVALLVGVMWTSPAAAALYESHWNFLLASDKIPDPNPTPFWDCPTVAADGLICSYLWGLGIEVSSNTALPMYGDGGPRYDEFGVPLPLESELPLPGLLRLAPACRDGMSPCFKVFTPSYMEAFSNDPDVGVFMTSSRGGLVTTLNGNATFAGAEWTDIAWIQVGLFFPDACGDPQSGLQCGPGEHTLYVQRLHYEAVPEPAVVWLLGAGLFMSIRNRRRWR